MVSALDPGASGPDSKPWLGTFVSCTMPFSIKVYKWVPARFMLMLQVILRWTSIPFRRGLGEEEYS